MTHLRLCQRDVSIQSSVLPPSAPLRGQTGFSHANRAPRIWWVLRGNLRSLLEVLHTTVTTETIKLRKMGLKFESYSVKALFKLQNLNLIAFRMITLKTDTMFGQSVWASKPGWLVFKRHSLFVLEPQNVSFYYRKQKEAIN